MPSEPRGQGLIAWAVILGLVGVVLMRPARPAGPAAGGTAAATERKLQGRYAVGLKAMGMDGEAVLEQTRPHFPDEPMPRIAFAALTAELAGEDAALAELVLIEADTGDEVRAADLVADLVRGREVSDEDRHWLIAKLGWFGELAVARQDEGLHADLVAGGVRTVVVLVAALLLGVFALLAGVGVAVGAGFAASQGWTAAASLEGGHGGVYAETFAIYLALYLGLSALASFHRWGGWSLGVSGGAMVLSLAALWWPQLRGVKWSQVRDDVGLNLSWLDLPAGVATYLGAVPLLVAGLLVMMAARAGLRWTGLDPPTPSHPVAEVALGAPWWVWAQLFAVACVGAPVVEEVFFRGVLYAHLSRLGKGWPTAARVGLAAGGSSILFAAIHPQGWLGVPVLAGLATAFALAREWRGGVGPGVIAHAINNGVATGVLFLAAG